MVAEANPAQGWNERHPSPDERVVGEVRSLAAGVAGKREERASVGGPPRPPGVDPVGPPHRRAVEGPAGPLLEPFHVLASSSAIEEDGPSLRFWRTFLAGPDERGQLDWSKAFLDGTFFPAHKRGPRSGRQRGEGHEGLRLLPVLDLRHWVVPGRDSASGHGPRTHAHSKLPYSDSRRYGCQIAHTATVRVPESLILDPDSGYVCFANGAANPPPCILLSRSSYEDMSVFVRCASC